MCVCTCVHVCVFNMYYSIVCDQLCSSLWALHIGSTSKLSSEQRHDLISTTFHRCSNVRCPLGYLSYLCFCFTYLQHISLTFGGH